MRGRPTRHQVCERLLAWIGAANPDRDTSALDRATPLIASRWITSLQVSELLVEIERILGQPLDLDQLGPGVFRDVETIVTVFFDPAGAEPAAIDEAALESPALESPAIRPWAEVAR